jgi:hypothetical protein
MYTVAERSARVDVATPARRRPHRSGSVCMSNSMPAGIFTQLVSDYTYRAQRSDKVAWPIVYGRQLTGP